MLTEFTPVPLPATVVQMGKRKYRVEMLPSYQFKGGEILEISPRQIKAVFADEEQSSRTDRQVNAEQPGETKTETKTTFEPASAATKPLKLEGSARAGERARSLSGLYTCFSQKFEGKKLVCREEQFYFFSDGRVWRGMPDGAPGLLDWQVASKSDRAGSYGINGDTIIFNWKNETVTWSLKRKGGQVEMNGLVADRAPQFAPGIHIDGSYERDEVNLINGKPLTSKKTYTFMPDGKLVIVDRSGPTAGTYELSGNDLKIKTAGYSKSYLAYPLYLESGKTKRPERISIGGQLYFLCCASK